MSKGAGCWFIIVWFLIHAGAIAGGVFQLAEQRTSVGQWYATAYFGIALFLFGLAIAVRCQI